MLNGLPWKGTKIIVIFETAPKYCTSSSSVDCEGYSTSSKGLLPTAVIIQLLSCVRLFVTPSMPGFLGMLPFTISWSLLKLRSIESVMLSNHLILCCPLLLMPSILPSIRVFYNGLALCIRWPKYWSFSTNISNEYSGLISFSIDWFDLAVQGTHKSLSSTIQKHQLFGAQSYSHLYMTTGKTIALTRWTFVGKVMSLFFNTLSCHSFSSKEQVSFDFMAAVTIHSDFGAQENTVCRTVSHLFAMKWWNLMPWS